MKDPFMIAQCCTGETWAIVIVISETEGLCGLCLCSGQPLKAKSAEVGVYISDSGRLRGNVAVIVYGLSGSIACLYHFIILNITKETAWSVC